MSKIPPLVIGTAPGFAAISGFGEFDTFMTLNDPIHRLARECAAKHGLSEIDRLRVTLWMQSIQLEAMKATDLDLSRSAAGTAAVIRILG